MRISLISEHASPLATLGGVDAGGQNVHVAALSTALGAQGHDVSVYTRRDSTALPRECELAPGVRVVHVDAGPPSTVPKDELLPYMTALADGIAADWERRPPEVVHSHFWMSGVAALQAVAQTTGPRPPVLHTFHALGTVKRRFQGLLDTSPPERETLEPWVGRTVDRVIATCSDEVFELRAMDVDASRISIAPCGVDTELFSPDGDAEPRGTAVRILCVGRLVPRKGVDTVIAALGRLVAQGLQDVELLVVGGPSEAGLDSDPEVARLLTLARELGVGDKVTMRGQVEHRRLPALLRSADMVVCTPWYEPFGIVPLEAMACGVPVIASTVGGLVDTVAHGVSGLQVPVRDVEATAEAMGFLAREQRLARSFGASGRRLVVARYGWPRIASLTAACYRESRRALRDGVLSPPRHTGLLHELASGPGLQERAQ